MAEEIDTVLFDLDDTLCRYHQPVDVVLEHAFESVGVEPLFSPEEYVARYDEFAAKTDSSDALRRACFAELAAEHGHAPDTGRAVADAYAAERDHTDVSPFPGAIETLDSLRDTHTLGLITNGAPDAQQPKLDALGIRPMFDLVLCAGFTVPSKPAPDAFEQALSELDGTAATSIYVGNSLESDVSGAQAAGIDAVWFTNGDQPPRTPEPQPEYVIDAIPDVLDVVGSSA